jgi:AcrR family transcriptional regulator
VSKIFEKMRKNPSQERASATVETFFEATAQLLDRDDAGVLTTNHIAQRAGYSVGTLYSYFPNKQSLLRALALREMRKQESAVLSRIAQMGSDQSLEELARALIVAALRPFGSRQRLRVKMLKFLTQHPEVKKVVSEVRYHVLDVVLATLSEQLGRNLRPSKSARFVLVAAISGTFEAALWEQPELLETPEFEDELVAMVVAAISRFDAQPA